MKKRPLFLTVLLTAAAASPLCAATLYWDANAAQPGAGTAPGGDWATNPFWSSDPAGLLAGTAAWVATTDSAVFAAGTDAVGAYTVSGNATTAGITVEEGALTLSGTITLGAGPVSVKAGASLITNSSLRISSSIGSVYTLDGGKLETTNTGAAGSFIDNDSTIFLAAGGGTIAYSLTTPPQLNIINFSTANPVGTTIAGPGSLTKVGSGVIAIATTCTYEGTTTVNDGELRVRFAANRLPVTTAVTVNAPGILNLNGVAQQIGSLAGNGTVGLANATLTVGDATSTTFSGVIKDTANVPLTNGSATLGGSVTKTGAGTLTLTGLNAHTTLTTLSAGGITVDPGASLSGATANLTVNGGTLTLNNTAQTIKGLAGTGGNIVLAAGHVLTSDPVASTACASTISGDGSLTRLNADATNRTLTLTGANTYTGVTTITKGIISVGSATALGSTAGATEVQATGEVLFTGATTNFTVAEPIRIAGAGSTDNGAIAVIASANPTLTGLITLTGDATVTVSGSASATFGAFASPTNQTLTLAGGNNAAGVKLITGALNLGTGGLIKTQSGKWTLSGSSPYSGPTAINAGTLQVDGALTASPVTVNTGGTLAGGGTLGAAVIVASDGTVAPGASAGTLNFGSTLDIQAGSFYSAEITGAAANDKVNVTGALTVNGTVKVTLSGYTPVSGNTFDLADAASFAGTPVFDFSSATLTAGLTWNTSQFLTNGTISVSGVAGDPFDAWATANGVTGGKSGDDDGDGASNLLEFATNSNPKTDATGARAFGRLHPLGGDRVLTLTVATRSGASFSGAIQQAATKDNVIYTVEGSDDLTSWNVVVITELNAADSAAVQAALTLPALDAGWEWHSFRTDGGISTDPRDLVRLSVAAQP